MILIVDGGSTKCDWVALSFQGQKILHTQTIGFSPVIITSEIIETELVKNKELINIAQEVKYLFFYGAGCASENFRQILKKPFAKIYSVAKISIEHDLKGAALSAYFGRPAIICILGTGSNACFFDGEKLREETDSLGWILADEGSGAYLGKKLINAYFSKKMPESLSQAFEQKYNLNIDILLENVYKKPRANSYLANFNHFILEHKNEPFLQNLVYKAICAFFENQVIVFPEAKTVEINFIGSIAHYYESIIRNAAAEYYLKIGEIVKRPIDNLVKYYQIYKLPNLLK